MPSRNPSFGEGGKKMGKKKMDRPKTDGRSAPKTYPVEPLSVKYCAFRKWKFATRFQETGERRSPKEGEWYLSGNEACVASFDFDGGRRTMLEPVREVPGAKRPVAAKRRRVPNA